MSGLRQGERDYQNIRGGTGPLVYPAGFLYLFSGLRALTGGGDIAAAQASYGVSRPCSKLTGGLLSLDPRLRAGQHTLATCPASCSTGLPTWSFHTKSAGRSSRRSQRSVASSTPTGVPVPASCLMSGDSDLGVLVHNRYYRLVQKVLTSVDSAHAERTVVVLRLGTAVQAVFAAMYLATQAAALALYVHSQVDTSYMSVRP